MPWKEVTAMDEKKRFIDTYLDWRGSFLRLCKEFGISPKTGYKYVAKYQTLGLLGLAEQSRRPRHSPTKTKNEIERLVLSVREEHPSWSGEKIRRYLMNKGHRTVPTEKTIDRILKRHGLITAEESEKH